MPENSIQWHRKSDNVPYDVWATEGLIFTTPGDVVDYDVVFAKIKELSQKYKISEIAFDRWNSGQIVQQIENIGIQPVPFGQGYASMSGPTKALINLVIQKKIHHGNNPVLNFMSDCASVVQDPAENIKLVKPDRRKSSKRIDGMVSLVMALDRALRHMEAEKRKKESIYESQDLFVL
jgi:phage terminase large subunit-like protein